MSVNPYQSLMTAVFRKTFRADFENPEWPESGDHPAVDLEFLDRFENDVLSDEERTAFLRHLETCPFCRQEIAFLIRTGILLPEPVAESEAPSKPIAAVQTKREKFGIWTGRHLNNRILTATALLLLIIGAAVLFWPSGTQMVARRGDSLTLSPNAQKFALLIGVDDYANLSDLEYANNDVDAIENQLLAMGFDKGNIFKLSDKLEADKHPFRKNIEKHIEKVLRASGKDDFLFLAFVGHGVKIANKVYFCPQDADVNAIKETAISMDSLTKNLEKSPAHLKWLNIDACRDDPFSGYRDAKPSDIFDIELNLSKKASQKSGLVIFQSCSDGQRSKEDDDLQQGIFSYSLVEGLKKVAEKGSGTIDDVWEYTRRQTGAMSEYDQTPLKIGDAGDFVIFDAPPAEEPPAETPKEKETEPQEPQGAPKNEKLDVGTQPGETRTITVNEVSYTFCWCPPGDFMMGSPETEPRRRDEEIQHPVRLSHGFWMLQSEVTQEMWQSLMGSTIEDLYLKSMSDPGLKGIGPNFPIYYVNWYEAKEFCEKLSEQTGYLFDLPTEAQWEYACRAGTEGPFSGSLALGKMGWYELNSEGAAHEVKQKEPNAWGLYDIHGNVFEWCLDWFDEDYYTVSPVDDPEGPAHGLDKVNRGGDFNVGPGCVRAAFRNRNEPQERFSDLGFRVIALPNSESAKVPEAEAAPSRETEEISAEVLPKPSRKYVLLVGVNDYDDTDLPNLSTEQDVFLIRDRLLDAGFKSDRIVLLSDASGADGAPTKETIEKYIEQALELVHQNDMFLFVFSGLGTGAADGSYLLPQDAWRDDIQNTAISVNKLINRLRESPSRFKLIVLDAGREGEASAEQPLPPGLVVFRGCQEDEKALANDGFSLFSRCFADGLHGEADRDRNGEITLSELIRYTTERTEEMAKSKALQQTPCVRGLKGDYVVVNVKPGKKKTVTVKGVDYTFCWCPPGEFLMGSPETEEGRYGDEKQHRVTLTQGFWMLESEVTQEMWESVMGTTVLQQRDMANPDWDLKGIGAHYPICYVDWDDANAFCRKLSELSGENITLPTEAQAQYACRAGSAGAYGGTGILDDMGWYDENSNGSTHEVKQKKPNAWGLYDMHGNVWEWCSDFYGEYQDSAAVDPVGPSDGTARVHRGGGWGIIARNCRSASRYGDTPLDRNCDVGFRIVLIPVSCAPSQTP